MASHVQGECPERGSAAPESKGAERSCVYDADDGIVVVVVHFVYILRCADKTLYIGETADLDRRLEQHRDGSACSFTASRRPVALVYSEPHASRATALRRERQLKRWTRAKKEALIAGNVALLKRL
jgi:predicted GIY-YIG superfamily endonuclease